MDVATALLDASRRLSEGEARKDKIGDHEQRGSWFGTWGGRSRTNSSSDTSLPWLAGVSPQKTDHKNYLKVDLMRVRRNSSRDAEEAMAGGLGKADMYLPPM